MTSVIKLSCSGRDLASYEVFPDEDMDSEDLILSVFFTYSDQGYRTSKTYTNTITSESYTIEYTLLDGQVIYETDGTYGIYFTYDDTGTIVSLNYDSDVSSIGNGIEYFYMRNIQGDIVAITDFSGNIVVEYIYDSYGNILYQTNNTLASINPYRYRGYRYDEETNWFYLQSRYYNSESARFINNDIIISEFTSTNTSMFSYTSNNPINNIDQSGYAKTKLVGVGIQLAFSLSFSWVVISMGVELVWYISNQVDVGNHSRYLPYVYVFAAAGFEYLFNNVNLMDRLFRQLFYMGGDYSLFSGGISASIFTIFGVTKGKYKFKNPNDYLGWFSTTQFNFGVGLIYTSKSKTCVVYGVGKYLLGYSQGFSRSRSYYVTGKSFIDAILRLMTNTGTSTSIPSY